MKRIKGFKFNKKEKYYYYGDVLNGIRIIESDSKYIATCFVKGDFYGPFGSWDTLELAIDEMLETYREKLEN